MLDFENNANIDEAVCNEISAGGNGHL